MLTSKTLAEIFMLATTALGACYKSESDCVRTFFDDAVCPTSPAIMDKGKKIVYCEDSSTIVRQTLSPVPFSTDPKAWEICKTGQKLNGIGPVCRTDYFSIPAYCAP